MLGTIEPIGPQDNPMSYIRGLVVKYQDDPDVTKEDIWKYLKALVENS